MNNLLNDLKELIARYDVEEKQPQPYEQKDFDVIIKECWMDKTKNLKCLTIAFNADLESLVSETGYIFCFAEGDKLYFIKAKEDSGLKLTNGRFRISSQSKFKEFRRFAGCFELQNDELRNLYYVEVKS